MTIEQEPENKNEVEKNSKVLTDLSFIKKLIDKFKNKKSKE